MKKTMKTLVLAGMVSIAAVMSTTAYARPCLLDVCIGSEYETGGAGGTAPDPDAKMKDEMRRKKAACMNWNLNHPLQKKDCSVFD